MDDPPRTRRWPWGAPNGVRSSLRTTTDENGTFTFREVPQGTVHVRAGGGAGGLAELTLELASGVATRCTAQLQPGPRVLGRLVDSTGGQVAGWAIEYEGIDEPWFAAATSQNDGTFVVPVHHGVRGRLLLWQPAVSSGLPVAVVPEVVVNRPELALEIPFVSTASGLQLRVPSAATEVQLFQELSGRGTVLQPNSSGPPREQGERSPSDEVACFSASGLTAGWYRVFVATLSHGSVDLGRHWLDGHTLVDLGTIALPDLAHVRFEWPQSPQGSPMPEVYQEGADVDLRLDGLDCRKPEGVDLPPGDFEMFWPDARGEVQHRRFTLRAGERTVVRAGG